MRIGRAIAISLGDGGSSAPAGPPVISGLQTVGLQVVASAYAPIVGTQSVVLAVTATSGSYSPANEASPLAWFDMLDPTAYTLNGGLTGVTYDWS